MVAGFLTQAHRIGNERLKQPHQRPPLLHGAAEVMHGVLAGALRIGNNRVRAGKDIGRDRAHRRPDRRLGPQGGFLPHIDF